MIAVVVGEYSPHSQMLMQRAAERAGTHCVFVSGVERARGLLGSLDTSPRCVFVSVRADVSSLAESMRDSVEHYTIPIIGLVPFPSSESYQLANRQGADDCIPEYDTGAMTRRLANLVQGEAPRLPAINSGRALVAVSDARQRKHIGRRLRSAGYDVEFLSEERRPTEIEVGESHPVSVLVATPSFPPTAELSAVEGASDSQGRPIPRVNLPLSNFDPLSSRELSDPEITDRLMFLVDEATRPVLKDARASRRIQHSAIATFRTQRSFEHTYALTDNISKQGLYLRTLDPPSVGADVRINIRDKYGDILQIRGTVAWRHAPSRVGGRTCPGFGIAIQEQACPPGDLEKYHAQYEEILREVERLESCMTGGSPDSKPSGVHPTWSEEGDRGSSEVG